MNKLKTPNIDKPKFVSEAVTKLRSEMKVISLSGKGDPLKTFDRKIARILDFLGNEQAQAKPAMGIYYKDRRNVGVKNVEWDACVPVDNEITTKDDIKYKVLPEAQVISITLTGGYDLIGPSLQYLEKVAQINNIKTAWPLTEIYLEEGDKPVTELQYFIK